jgi:hypothetical protein
MRTLIASAVPCGLALLLLPANTDGQFTALPYHLTARPWRPLDIGKKTYLDAIEGVCRYSIRHQNNQGAIIDPFLKREHQYATPYFAHAVGALVHEGRALDLLPYGIKAMEHSTTCFAGGRKAIPDEHGEFFIAALTGALPLYEKHVPATQFQRWRERMKTPRAAVIRGGLNNWETYVMKGEWMRFQAGLADRSSAIAATETAWSERHRGRIAAAPFFLYHDRSSDPDTLNVEAVGRGNLLALTHMGYDGPSAKEIRRIVEAASRTTLLLQDPTGQAPTNGRTDDHVWVDIGYQLAFEVMAERMRTAGDLESAGQFRHAAMLAFANAQRWRRADGEWAGSYYVTKNHFDPALRVGHQTASQYSNYNGSLMFHLAEAYHLRTSEIAERPAPAEIGGYAFGLDREFSSAFANAGGMQVQVNLRGQTAESSGNWWTPLGIVRLARVGWDTRLGPSDGALTAQGGVTFAPTFEENGRWFRMGDLSARYEGKWSVEFVHPLLVRCAVTYSPKQGKSGPTFRNDLVLTPDGVLSTVTKTSGGDTRWGVTWPLLENDGRPVQHTGTAHVRTTAYPGGTDDQNFIALDAQPHLALDEPLFRSTYGDLRPVRMTVADKISRTFVYPRSAGDPAAEEVRKSVKVTGDGFTSTLARVRGDLYAGRTSAGGVGTELDVDGDGRADVRFNERCGFLLQLRAGRVTAVEADRDVSGEIQGRKVQLRAYSPVSFN